GRCLDQAGDNRRFPQAQMLGAMAKEGPAGGIDAIGTTAEIDAVQIELEDLILGEFAFQGEGKDAFLPLSAERPAVGQEDVARQLLSDGRPALPPGSCLDPDLERARHADRIDADMAGETLVLS